jgi:hypothetical protein
LIDPAAVPVLRVQWNPCYRLIASRFPTVGLFDSVTAPEDLEVVFAFESLTNDRLRAEAGDIRLVPPDERVVGPGSTPIMASFTHLNPDGSRFSNGEYGVYYCANNRDTAIAEVIHHQAIFLRRTDEPAIDVDMRLITATLNAELHDLRDLRSQAPELYDAASYQASQPFGTRLRDSGSWGIAYRSVRLEGGECAGVFRPRALSGAASAGHIALHWDGQRITHWYQKQGPISVSQ